MDRIYSTGSAAARTEKLLKRAGKKLSIEKPPYQLEDSYQQKQGNKDQGNRRNQPLRQVHEKHDGV